MSTFPTGQNRFRVFLLVILVLGYGASPCVLSAQEPEPSGPPRHDLEQNIDRMVQQVELGIRESDTALEQLAARIPELQERMARLAERIKSIEAPKQEEPERNEPPPRDVLYRLPIEEFSKKTEILFLCKEGRVSWLDFGMVNDVLKPLLRPGKVEVNEDLPGSDFRLTGHVYVKLLGGFDMKQTDLSVVRRPGYPGESPDQIRQANSRFRKVLSSRGKPESHRVMFGVRPDSYEIFRQARAFAWDAGYEVGWTPMEPGEHLKLGTGGIGVTD